MKDLNEIIVFFAQKERLKDDERNYYRSLLAFQALQLDIASRMLERDALQQGLIDEGLQGFTKIMSG